MRRAFVLISLCLALNLPELAAADQQSSLDVGPGRIAWFDLTTGDLAKSKAFYGALFDWQFTALAGTELAVEIVAGGTAIGSLRVAEGQLSPFNGVVYVQVEDIAAACAKAQQLGALLAPGFPFDLPGGGGAIGLVLDPAGHPVGMYSPTPLASAAAPPE